MVEGKDFVDMCVVCKQGVPRTEMEYQKGKVFHVQCFTDHGNTVLTVDPELAHLSARTRIELVQLKNLKIRTDREEPQLEDVKQPTIITKSKPKKKINIKKSTMKKVKKSKSKVKKTKPKKRNASKR